MPKQHPPGSYDSLGQIKREYTANYVREHFTIPGAMSDYVSFDQLDRMSDRDQEQNKKPDNPLPSQSIREPVAASDHVVENLTQFLLKKRPFINVTVQLIQRKTRLLPNLER